MPELASTIIKRWSQPAFDLYPNNSENGTAAAQVPSGKMPFCFSNGCLATPNLVNYK
jgi:hypothetical protein